MQANNNRRRNFLFWWRLANEMYIYGSKKQKKTGLWINRKLNSKFGIDIELGAVIGYGLDIPHHMGIVITKKARIGCNLSLKQNTTVGNKQGLKEDDFGNDSNLLIVFYVQIMPDDFVMQLHRF